MLNRERASVTSEYRYRTKGSSDIGRILTERNALSDLLDGDEKNTIPIPFLIVGIQAVLMTSDDSPSSTIPRREVLAAAATGTVAVAGVGVIGARTTPGDGDRQRRFTAELSPENAVPSAGENRPYDADDATGEATVELDESGSELTWTVTLSNVQCVTGSHIHRGSRGENGPHLAELFNLATPSEELDGARWTERFGSEDICGSDKNNCLSEGTAFDALVSAMRADETYVQTHMTDGRVIRGQLK